ncbi:MAG: hypothetical protein KTR32_40685 [Granulosicoccus sp.]|nr:hypothetical protein [Granulosicoccus sp.]
MNNNSTKSDFNPRTWHPIRLPYSANGGKRAFPKLNTFSSREPEDMRLWIDQNCKGGWRHEIGEDDNSIFWFEAQAEALEFALFWFPFKCV